MSPFWSPEILYLSYLETAIAVTCLLWRECAEASKVWQFQSRMLPVLVPVMRRLPSLIHFNAN